MHKHTEVDMYIPRHDLSLCCRSFIASLLIEIKTGDCFIAVVGIFLQGEYCSFSNESCSV